tara:strand:+ start:11471 stop:11809 length:339 start_codon:yes stop_codon:yes gene_type:complete
MEVATENKVVPIDRLTKIRDEIESFDKGQQIQILKILKEKQIPINENKNGVFINLTNVAESIISELENYITHISNQEKILQENENLKDNYKQNFFDKDNKETLQNNVNAGFI